MGTGIPYRERHLDQWAGYKPPVPHESGASF
jgi:hypothetical protein